MKMRPHIEAMFDRLMERDEVSAYHSVRMASMAGILAQNVGLDRQLFQEACLTHDLGKMDIPKKIDLLSDGKRQIIYYEIESHPVRSYRHLHDSEPTLAKIASMHHLFQRNPYPAELPFTEQDEKEANELYRYALAVSCLDFLDASTYRSGREPVEDDFLRVIAVKSPFDPEPDFVRRLFGRARKKEKEIQSQGILHFPA